MGGVTDSRWRMCLEDMGKRVVMGGGRDVNLEEAGWSCLKYSAWWRLHHDQGIARDVRTTYLRTYSWERLHEQRLRSRFAERIREPNVNYKDFGLVLGHEHPRAISR